MAQYKGPQQREEEEYKVKYKPNKDVCKEGWCNHPN
jgi:hypothetical protein